MGLIDMAAWEETDRQSEGEDTEPNAFRLNITITRSNLLNAPGVRPNVDELILEHRVNTE